MKKSPDNKSYWNEVHGTAKLRYLFDYYKFPLVLIGIVIYIIIWVISRNASRQDYALYVGLVNVVISDELACDLEKGLASQAAADARVDLDKPSDPDAQTGSDMPANTAGSVFLYRNLFLTTDMNSEYHQYSYASRMKILGAVNAGQMDLVLMDREAFDAFSQNGYLADLSVLLCGLENEEDLQPMLVRNIFIEEDNSTDVLLGTAEKYEAVTKEGMYGLDLSGAGTLLGKSGFNGTVYLGIVDNSPRKEEAVQYLAYLTA